MVVAASASEWTYRYDSTLGNQLVYGCRLSPPYRTVEKRHAGERRPHTRWNSYGLATIRWRSQLRLEVDVANIAPFGREVRPLCHEPLLNRARRAIPSARCSERPSPVCRQI